MGRPREILLDYETRSTCDLTKRGAHVYAADPSTSILCYAWVDVNERSKRGVYRAWPNANEPHPDWVYDPHAAIYAWNAAFEIAITKDVATRQFGWPDISADRFVCLMKMAAHAGMPLALDRATVAAGLEVAKDMTGHRMMMRWCKPLPQSKADKEAIKAGKTPPVRWADDPAEYDILCAYAEDDARAELGMLDALTGSASDFEMEMMRIDQRINDRGFRIDTEAAEGAAKIAAEEVKRLNAAMRRLTNGEITTCNQRDRILAFAARHGVDLPNLRSGEVKDTLAGEEHDGAEDDLAQVALPPIVRQVLELRVEANKASVAKLRAMVRGVGTDGRFRGGFAYGGAAKTLRWAGRRVQPHNFSRENPPAEVPEEVWFDALASGDREYFASLLPDGMTVMDGLKSSLRGMIIP